MTDGWNKFAKPEERKPLPPKDNKARVEFWIRDLDVVNELEKEKSLFHKHDKPAPLQPLHNYVGAMGPTFLFEVGGSFKHSYDGNNFKAYFVCFS